ncbi:MAG TPA: hypothetical protein VFY12_01130, partial [Arenimonas sp.]|nr:hypothetical protein [Arenimonas sp.]
KIDGRSDQYSLGVMFYEMMAKKAPFEAETPMQVAMAHVTAPPPPLPLQFAFAQPLMDKLLAKKPADRYPDLKTFSRELKRMLSGSPVLQSRMEMDPSQDVSGQLEALGFSDGKGKPGVALSIDPEIAPGGLANQLLANSDLSLAPVVEKHRPPPPPPPPPLPVGKVISAVLTVVGAAIALKLVMDYLG